MRQKRIFMDSDFTVSSESHNSGGAMPYVHYHDSYELYILTSGERTVFTAGNEYKTEARDVVLFNKGVPHKSRGETPFSGICVHILDKFIDRYFTREAKSKMLACFDNTVIRLNQSELGAITEIADNFIIGNENNFLVLARIMEIINTAAARCESAAPISDKRDKSKAERLLEYIDNNYIYINKIPEVAERFNVSESYIFKLFRHARNIPPKEYLRDLKLGYAMRKLESTNDTIKSVAYESGFECYEYFIRLFKSKTGVTPSEYRKNYKQKRSEA